jgi:hypothetical protein
MLNRLFRNRVSTEKNEEKAFQDISGPGCSAIRMNGYDQLLGLNIINPATAPNQKTKHRLQFIIRLSLFEILFEVAGQRVPGAVFHRCTHAMMHIGFSAE